MKIDKTLLMQTEEGTAWHEFKASLGPIYPGYESFDVFLNWVKEKLEGYGCTDTREHHWTHETYRVDDWPDHESGALGLTIGGKEIPVGTFLMLSRSTGEEGLTAPLVYYDPSEGAPEDDAFSEKIVVMEEPPMPEKPFTERFLESFVATDTNYRSGPALPAEMFEIADPEVNNSWNTRWSFASWGSLAEAASKGNAAGLLIVSRLTYGCLKGLYDRQMKRPMPSLVIDRMNGREVLEAAREGKTACMKLISRFYPADAWNFVTFLPGKDYGTDRDQYVTINVHVDAMSLTQDNGALGAVGIARYFSHIPQALRAKTLLFCIDSRHFIEGFEFGNFEHDPYQVWPDLVPKVTVTVGLEHMGEMEGAEDYEHNTMVPTGRPEFSFMKADDNDFCARILIEAAIDSGLQRADIKIDGRPGIHGAYKGLVRAVQASCHRLDVCVIGEAGNWCGAHTQTFSGMQYFGPDKFRDEVHTWTQVVQDLMDADAVVYDVSWSQLNASVRELNRKGSLTAPALEGLLELISGIFREVEEGAYRKALERLEKEVRPVLLPFFEEASEEEDKEAPLRAMFGKKQLPVSEALDKVVRCLGTRIETGGN
ncbi:MAG: hypothetical protein IJL98_02510 [Lachnospiraceae bacterium]|nr:hypothetical protein [Lachnospiraceae bacterium]